MSESRVYEEKEIRIKEELASIDESELLDITQENAIQLTAALSAARVSVKSGESISDWDMDLLKRRIARTAVLLDVLQLRYGDCADLEEAFLQDIEGCLE